MKKVLIVFILAFAVRLIALNQSLWLDEGVTAHVLKSYSPLQIIQLFSPLDFHPPLFYEFLKLWTGIFGFSEVSLRLPSVIFSLIAGWFVYLTAKKLKNETVGVWSAAFFLFNPLIIYYSQEARMYMMATCFLSIATYCYTVLLHEKKYSKWNYIIWFNVFVFLSFLTFYGSIFYISALYVYLFFKKNLKLFAYIHPGFLLALLLISPLLYQQFTHSREATNIVVNWHQVLGTASIKNLYLIPVKFMIGRVSWMPKIIYYAVSTLWTCSVLLFAFRQYKKYVIYVFLFLFPILLGLLFSVFSPLLQYFRFLYLIIPLSILLGVSIENRWQRIFVLTGLCIFSGMYLFIPSYKRENWKDLTTYLHNRAPIYAITSSMDVVGYYNPQTYASIKDIRMLPQIRPQEKTVYVLPYTAPLYGFDYRKPLIEKGYDIKESYNFRGVGVEIWKK